MSTAVQHIPRQLIYEMVEGKPIYYRGYKEYLNGKKQIEELMGSSLLQSFLVTKISFLLQQLLGEEYEDIQVNWVFNSPKTRGGRLRLQFLKQ